MLVDKGLKIFAADSQASLFQCFVTTVEKVRCSSLLLVMEILTRINPPSPYRCFQKSLWQQCVIRTK
eukprot:bmy_08994T0